VPSDSERPINLDGKLKLGVGTLVAIAVAMFALAGVYSNLPSKRDMQTSFAEHNSSSDAHPAYATSLRNLRDDSARLDARMGRIEGQQSETHDDVMYIRSRIDYLTEQTVRQVVRAEALRVTTAHRATQAGDRAVEGLRRGEQPRTAIQGSLDGL
jgi:hypothetical protein